MKILNAHDKTNNPNPHGTEEHSDHPVSKHPIPQTIRVTHFGLGVYLPSTQVREDARTYFFCILRKVWPELLCALKRDLLPIYLKWAEKYSIGRHSVHPPPQGFLELKRAAPEMAEVVLKWCSEFHLVGAVDAKPEGYGPDSETVALADSLWLAMFIYETLWVWSQPDLGLLPVNSDPPEWPHKNAWLGRIGGPRTLALRIPDPAGFNARAEYVRQAMKGFESQLREHLRLQEGPPNSRQPRSIEFRTDHFTWLVLRQAHGWSAKAIADWQRRNYHEHVSIDAVRIGIRSAARTVGLRLRPRPHGRPRKVEALPQ